MIQLFHVSKEYPGEPPALSDVTLDVEKGEFVFLTGPSGAGKSTLLKLIFCAEAPTSGQIFINGIDILDNPKEAKRELGYLPETPGLQTNLQSTASIPQVSLAEVL